MDAALFVGIFAALLLRHTASRLFYDRTFLAIFLIAVASLTVCAALLNIGVIQGAREGGRIFDVSMYYTASISAVLCPIVLPNLYLNRFRVIAVLLFMVWIGTTAVFADMSATRSVVIIAICSSILTIYVILRKLKNLSASIIFGIGFAIIALISLVVFGPKFQMDNLSNRIYVVGFSSEDRLVEAQLMLSELGSHWITGRGLGSGYYSQIVSQDNPDGFSIATHIGVLTFIFKLGILGLVAFIIIPFYKSAWHLIKYPNSEATGYASAIAVCYLQACISGGFHYTYTFVAALVFGAFLFHSDREFKYHQFFSPVKR